MVEPIYMSGLVEVKTRVQAIVPLKSGDRVETWRLQGGAQEPVPQDQRAEAADELGGEDQEYVPGDGAVDASEGRVWAVDRGQQHSQHRGLCGSSVQLLVGCPQHLLQGTTDQQGGEFSEPRPAELPAGPGEDGLPQADQPVEDDQGQVVGDGVDPGGDVQGEEPGDGGATDLRVGCGLLTGSAVFTTPRVVRQYHAVTGGLPSILTQGLS